MSQHDRRWTVGFGLILVGAALAPASRQQQPPPAPVPAAPTTPAELARTRAEAGTKAFDLAWLYYSEDRIDADKVYRWSRRSREADIAAATDQNGRVAAAEAHLTRMLKLEAKITRIRKLGFGNSLDVLEADYYRKEAEFWRAEAQAR